MSRGITKHGGGKEAMKKYELISTEQGVTLGKVECGSVEEAELFLAVNFPEDFFGANIKSEDGENVLLIPVKEAYEGEVNPVDIAVKNMDMRIKIRNRFCNVREEDDGVVYTPYKKLSSKNGDIIEG